MNPTETSYFYDDLPILDSFFQISDPTHYHALPPDWYIGITDIVNSTEAIEDEQYKRVNILGASPIVGLLNKTDQKMLPYSFGGDGCIVCIPPELLDETHTVFSASQQIGQAQYNLKLRAAIFPIQYLRDDGYDVLVSRFRVSDYYSQAVFSGGGLNYAEKLLKNRSKTPYHLSIDENPAVADFTGLECRWQEVKTPGKSVITLLVQSNPNNESPQAVYNKVLKKMRAIFGFDEKTNPITPSALEMNMSVPKLMGEAKFRTHDKSWFYRFLYLFKAELQILLGKVLMLFGTETSATDWSLYKGDLSLNSDHRKFDDMLRLVISGTPEQLNELKYFLQKLYEQSAIAYGIHTTGAALITCMVFAYHRQHIHFVDGSDGGYVKASQELKKRLRALQKT